MAPIDVSITLVVYDALAAATLEPALLLAQHCSSRRCCSQLWVVWATGAAGAALSGALAMPTCMSTYRMLTTALARLLADIWAKPTPPPENLAEVVCLYPSVFDLRSAPAGPQNRSTVMMQHFVSYVRGANGLEGVAL